MPVNPRCKICASPNAVTYNAMLRTGATRGAVVDKAASLGETFYNSNLDSHRPHLEVEGADTLADEIAEIAQELRDEMASAPTVLKPLYVAALRDLEGLSHTKPSKESLVRSLKAIMDIKGQSLEQEALAGLAINISARNKQNERRLRAVPEE